MKNRPTRYILFVLISNIFAMRNAYATYAHVLMAFLNIS
jgi:hypothetical protein